MIASTQPRLLLVHAHPDDESINNGATMAAYVARVSTVFSVDAVLWNFVCFWYLSCFHVVCSPQWIFAAICIRISAIFQWRTLHALTFVVC